MIYNWNFPLSVSKNKKRIAYSIKEYNPLLDSSNMTTDDWATIGKDIEVPAVGCFSFLSYIPNTDDDWCFKN